MDEILLILTKLNYTISSCESLTGGLFAQQLTALSGASKVFKGTIVAYSNEVKINIVKVKKQIITKFGAISSQCALEMVKNTKKILNTDICISFTGNAGPLKSENKEVGLVYIGFSIKDDLWYETLYLKGSRADIRTEVISRTIIILKEYLLNKN